ncbi:efflux RND transporter periplasmic adaptor subunit [Altererythrobacter sp. CC-YST694]|nr:efflux RND transporter periplasmic adaptor subunit [Altererythrobacter sp. CC-YST694]
MGRFFARWRWSILIALLLLAGLAVAFWPRAAAVDTGKVSRGPMEVGITDDGVTRAEEYYVVTAPVTGYLSRIELEPGDRVKSGTLVTTMSGRPAAPLDPRTTQSLGAALAAARAAEASSAASLGQAQRDLERGQALAERGFLARAQLETIRTRVAMNQAALAQARAEAARIMAELAPTRGQTGRSSVPVRSPVGGTVLSLITESEGAIAEGTPLVTVGDPRRIEVVIDLLSREAVRVKPGDRVRIEQWGGPRPLTGTVQRIEPFGRLKISALGIEEQRVNVIIAFDEAAAEQGQRLGHGYQLDATIIVWSRPDALRVPIGALFRDSQGEWRVYVVAGGRAVATTVRIGQINDEWGEVLSGLANGQAVVLNPSPSLKDGARVTARK